LDLHAFPTRRSSDLATAQAIAPYVDEQTLALAHVDVTRLDVDALLASVRELGKLDDEDAAFIKSRVAPWVADFTHAGAKDLYVRSEEHTSELQSPDH